jgi:LEA14-like dessication related protein
MKKLIIIGVLGGLGLYLYNRQKQNLGELSQSLTINPSGISIDTNNFFSPKIILTMELNNPTPTEFSITKIFGTVTNNGQQIATINNNETINISAQTISKVPVQINGDTISIVTNILRGDLGYEFVVNGYVQAGLIQVPFNKTLTLPNIR